MPGLGELLVRPSTAWAIELNVALRVPEWDGQRVLFMLEEDAILDEQGPRWIDGRQRELLLVPRDR